MITVCRWIYGLHEARSPIDESLFASLQPDVEISMRRFPTLPEAFAFCRDTWGDDVVIHSDDGEMYVVLPPGSNPDLYEGKWIAGIRTSPRAYGTDWDSFIDLPQ